MSNLSLDFSILNKTWISNVVGSQQRIKEVKVLKGNERHTIYKNKTNK